MYYKIWELQLVNPKRIKYTSLSNYIKYNYQKK